MLRADWNDYNKKPKSNVVETPQPLADWLCELLYTPDMKWVFDPAVGRGRLTKPFKDKGCNIWGNDPYTKPGNCFEHLDIETNHLFEDIPPEGEFKYYHNLNENEIEFSLVVCNPPFNGAPGRKLYPEVFLHKMVELFGNDIPICLFVPLGFRINQRKCSKRFRWMRDEGPKITTIISNLIDIFDGIQFQSEILIFNRPDLESHYWIPEKVIDEIEKLKLEEK